MVSENIILFNDMKKKDDTIENTKSGLLSVLLLSYNSGNRILVAYEKLSILFAEHSIPFEFIVMDDGSKDDSYKIALDMEHINDNVFAYQLSKNCTSAISAFASLEVANGDCAILIPDDEQFPYSHIVDLYRLWQKGEKIIIPYRKMRYDSFWKNTFSYIFYAVINRISDITFPKGGADTVFLDREVVDIIVKKIRPKNTYFTTEVFKLGFNPYYYSYIRPKGINEKSRWSFRGRLKLASNIFFSCSSFPIKAIAGMGVFFSIISFLTILFYVISKLFRDEKTLGYVPSGWVSIIVFLCFFSGIILLALGVIAEYIWRIYDEVKDRPDYIIKKK